MKNVVESRDLGYGAKETRNVYPLDRWPYPLAEVVAFSYYL